MVLGNELWHIGGAGYKQQILLIFCFTGQDKEREEGGSSHGKLQGWEKVV